VLRKIMHCDELWIGEKKGIIIDGIALVIVHSEQGYSAFYDRCPHAGAMMSEGFLEGDRLICARHHWQFNAGSGKGINPPVTHLHSYPLVIDEEGMIWIELGEEAL
jgi:toluene monooxygenase system ferredoxin subunit